MNKKIIFSFLFFLCLLFGIMLLVNNSEKDLNKMKLTVISKNLDNIIMQDRNNVIYTFDDIDVDLGNEVEISYKGNIKKKNSIIDYKIKKVSSEKEIPEEWLDNGIFKDFYYLAYDKLKHMPLDEKIAQILLVHYPNSDGKEILSKNQFGGYLFFSKDFRDKNKDEVKSMFKQLQNVSKIPILTAVDEEGGTVVRVSSNPKLVASKFKSPSELYGDGGFLAIENDTIQKSMILNDLGINVNLAPVVDVSTNQDDYIHERTLKEDSKLTSKYAETVIDASKGMHVSYVLKHFPGYGNNLDTHDNVSVDTRPLNQLKKIDLPPFESGINAGAEAVLVSHNIVNNIDSRNPASLSSEVHNLLRKDLGFTGIIISDDLSMAALDEIENKTTKALLAGNDLLITADYEGSINEIKKALKEGTISEKLINKLAFRNLAWKYYKGLLFDNQK